MTFTAQSRSADDPPLVSIVIPVYNGSNFLNQAIDSALAQTYPACEIIVINDGSTDDGMTERIALSYGSRIRYFSKTNGGVASALNFGIDKMVGEYFSWLSHDDVYFPDKVAEQVSFLEQQDKAVVVYSSYDLIDARCNVLRTENKTYRTDEFSRALILDNPIQGCSALIPKECFTRAGLFNEELRTTQDYDMWFRMAQHYDFVHVDRVLLKSRVHLEQGTVTMSGVHTHECNEFLIQGMLKIVSDQHSELAGAEQRRFVADCISSFVTRSFHQAAHRAVLLYLKLLCLKDSSREARSLYPFWGYLSGQLRRLERCAKSAAGRG